MRFGVLFEVTLLHDYWMNIGPVVHEALSDERRLAVERRYSARELLDVAPTTATRAALAGHGMLFKITSSGFLVGVELEPASAVPRRPPSNETVLSFAVRVCDPFFFNYTAGVTPGFCYFANTSANEHAGGLFLSRPVPAHDATRAYGAGEVRTEVAGGITNLFQATVDTGPGALVSSDWQRVPADTHDPAATYQQGAVVLAGNELFRALVNGPGPDLTVATDWQNEGSLANQYVTQSDRLRRLPATFSVDVSSAASSTLELSVTRVGAVAPAWQRRFEADHAHTSLQADLRGLADGPYRLDVLDGAFAVLPGLGFEFYLSDEAAREGWFAVIEVFAGSGAFALLDGAGQLRSPEYSLRFLNNASRWRYRFPKSQAVGAGAEVAADPSDDRILVTPVPRPLTRIGSGPRLRADDPSTGSVSEQILLPRPKARFLSKQNNQWFSEIHLSNYPKLS